MPVVQAVVVFTSIGWYAYQGYSYGEKAGIAVAIFVGPEAAPVAIGLGAGLGTVAGMGVGAVIGIVAAAVLEGPSAP